MKKPTDGKKKPLYLDAFTIGRGPLFDTNNLLQHVLLEPGAKPPPPGMAVSYGWKRTPTRESR